jgi:hypothetical protein
VVDFTAAGARDDRAVAPGLRYAPPGGNDESIVGSGTITGGGSQPRDALRATAPVLDPTNFIHFQLLASFALTRWEL